MSNGDILADIIPCYRTFLIPVSFAYHAHSSDATNHASHHIHKKHREQVGKKIQLQPQHRTAAPSTSQPQLVISMTPIHTDLANSMRKDATQHQYFTFLEKMKFGWAPTLIDKIDWDPIHDALAKFHTSDQQRIRKMIISWLPVSTNIHRYDPSHSPECPTCHSTDETQHHLFECAHPSRSELWQKLQLQLDDFFNSTKAPNAIRNAIHHAIVRTNALHKSNDAPIPPHSAITAQLLADIKEVGRLQIFYGRLPISIRNAYQLSSANSISLSRSKTWLSKMITIIWTFSMRLWETRNADMHGHSTTTKQIKHKDRLAQQITLL